MGTVVTKSFKIKTKNGFSDPINFLSESVFFQDGKNLDSHLESLDNKIDTEIQDRKNADTALTNSINTLNTTLTSNINSVSSTLTGLIEAEGRTRESAISAEKTAREAADTAINEKIETLKNTDISQINTNISTLQTTTNENKTNISSLEDFIIGENIIEENTPCLVDQVGANATKAQENYNAIEALKVLVGAGSLEEGAPNLLNIINLLESRISVLEGLVLTAPDEPEIPEEPIE